MANRVGQQLGNYHLTRVLGRGGFAEVYLGEHIHLNTQAAIKVMHTRLESHDVEQFRAEARIIARLKHPHIVRVLEFGVEDSTPFLVMDYAFNGSLRQRHPEDVPLPLVTIVHYVKQVADALQYIHSQKLIHRDIKPQNMLLGSNNEVLLSDFGIALVTQSSSLQSPQDVAGTVAYMAPEQLRGKPRLASDQYALGVVVYEWLSGTRPFKGSYGEIASQHALVPPPPLNEKVAISPDVEQVVQTALAKDAKDRFASVAAFANALEQVNQPKPNRLSISSSNANFPRTAPTHAIIDGEIEDLGDEGDIMQPRRLSESALEEEAEPSHNYGMQRRGSRQGSLTEEDEGEDALPSQDQPRRTIPPPPSPVRPSPLPLSAGTAGSRPPILQPPMQQRPRTPAAGQPLRASARGTPAASAPQRAVRPSAPGTGRPATPAWLPRASASRGSRSTIPILLTVLILFLIAMLAYGYFVPSADVTITIPAQNFSIPLALTATASSQQDAAHQTVRAQTLVLDKTLTATGHATGSKQVGTTPATGNVVFTNYGSQSVYIPPGTIVATNSGVQFATTANVLVLTVGSNVGNTIIVPVQAQSLGASGNVAANSITVISSDSLSKIAQANGNAPVNVSVTNPDPITNGGFGSAVAVTQKDVQTLQAMLDQQLRQQATAWLASQVHSGDVAGTPVQMEAPPVATPAAGGTATDGTFSENVSLHMTVLVVRAADLQTVAQAEFNAAAGRSKANYGLAPGQMLSLTQTTSKNCTPAIGGTSLTLCYIASGPIAPQMPLQQVRDALVGKTMKDALDYLNSIISSVGGVTTRPVITIQPGFFPWLPFWSKHITIHVNVVLPKK